jgi:hypothetical protein
MMTMNQDFMPHRPLWCVIACFIAVGGCIHDADRDKHAEIGPDRIAGDSGLLGDDGDGESVTGELGVPHINALALLSLRTYLDRY